MVVISGEHNGLLHLANEKIKPRESSIKSHFLLRNYTSSLDDFSGLANEDKNRANIYLFKVAIETLEKGVKYVQS